MSFVNDISILTFNVLAQPWIDEVLRKAALNPDHLRRQVRVARQVETFRYFDADVMLLQEVTPIVLGHYLKQLPHYEAACYSPTYWHSQNSKDPVTGNAILCRRGLLDYSDSFVINLNHKRDNFAAGVSGIFQGKAITIVCIHLEWGDIEVATAQFHHLMSFAAIRKCKRIIIGGDFNQGEPSFPIRKDYQSQGFLCCLPDDAPTHPFKEGPDARGVSHILLRGFLCVETVIGSSISIGHCLQKYGSDHYPAFVRTRLS